MEVTRSQAEVSEEHLGTVFLKVIKVIVSRTILENSDLVRVLNVYKPIPRHDVCLFFQIIDK